MLIIVRGAQGSGKSTFAKSLKGFTHIESDQFFMKDGKYQFNQEDLSKAHHWCLLQVTHSLTVGENVVVSNTFTKKWEVEPYIKLARELNIRYTIFHMLGEFKNEHGVPKPVVDAKRKEYEPFANEIPIKPVTIRG